MKATIKSDIGETLATIELPPVNFKTGSRGFRGVTKVSDGGRKYQVSVMAVEIGSKPQ